MKPSILVSAILVVCGSSAIAQVINDPYPQIINRRVEPTPTPSPTPLPDTTRAAVKTTSTASGTTTKTTLPGVINVKPIAPIAPLPEGRSTNPVKIDPRNAIYSNLPGVINEKPIAPIAPLPDVRQPIEPIAIKVAPKTTLPGVINEKPIAPIAPLPDSLKTTTAAKTTLPGVINVKPIAPIAPLPDVRQPIEPIAIKVAPKTTLPGVINEKPIAPIAPLPDSLKTTTAAKTTQPGVINVKPIAPIAPLPDVRQPIEPIAIKVAPKTTLPGVINEKPIAPIAPLPDVRQPIDPLPEVRHQMDPLAPVRPTGKTTLPGVINEKPIAPIAPLPDVRQPIDPLISFYEFERQSIVKQTLLRNQTFVHWGDTKKIAEIRAQIAQLQSELEAKRKSLGQQGAVVNKVSNIVEMTRLTVENSPQTKDMVAQLQRHHTAFVEQVSSGKANEVAVAKQMLPLLEHAIRDARVKNAGSVKVKTDSTQILLERAKGDLEKALRKARAL